MKNKKILIPIMIGAAAAGIYSAVKGKGIFNKRRFAREHDAVSRYIDSHYKGATYSEIQSVSGGWDTIITTPENKQIYLYITKTDEGVYLFHEENI